MAVESKASGKASGKARSLDSVQDPKPAAIQFPGAPTAPDTKEQLERTLRVADEHHYRAVRCLLETARNTAPIQHPRPDPTTSPFDGMIPENFSRNGVVRVDFHVDDQPIDVKDPSESRLGSMRVTKYKAAPVSMPRYAHYTTLKDSILSRNDLELRAWPELENERTQDELEEAMKRFFAGCNPKTRSRQLPERAKALQLEPYILAFLERGEVTVPEILSFLLQPATEINAILRSKGVELGNARDEFCARKVERQSPRVIEMRSKLPDLDYDQIARSYLACKIIKDTCDIRVWPAIGSFKKLNGPPNKKVVPPLKFQEGLQCRVCFIMNCPFHGEYKQQMHAAHNIAGFEASSSEDSYNHRARVTASMPKLRAQQIPTPNFHTSLTNGIGLADDGSVLGSASSNLTSSLPDSEVCSNGCFWKISNRSDIPTLDWTESQKIHLRVALRQYASNKRAPCIIAPSLPHACSEIWDMATKIIDGTELQDIEERQEPPPKKRKKNSKLFSVQPRTKNVDKTHILDQRPYFYPCDHKGRCDATKNCPCFKSQVHCMKSCKCANTCDRKFKGCKCAQRGTPCWTSSNCPCRHLNRECDPDLCGTCGAVDILDPTNRHLDEIGIGKCGNVSIQRGRPKHLILGKSQVAGFGLFAGEDIRQEGFLGEYCGETIDEDELNRRAEPYHYTENLYLFVISHKGPNADGMHASNKIRFINHSSDPEHQNCYPKLTLCNGVTRIGIFASTDIKAGEELFYDYCYGTEFLDKHPFREKGGGSCAERARAIGAEYQAGKIAKGSQQSTGGAPMALAKNTTGTASTDEMDTNEEDDASREEVSSEDETIGEEYFSSNEELENASEEEDGDYRDEVPASAALDTDGEGDLDGQPITRVTRGAGQKRKAFA